MPTYGYECLSCDNQFEIFQSIKDDPLKICDSCGGTLRKRVYPVGISFKGSGFYVNDYSKKSEGSSGTPAEPGKTDAPKSEAGGESKTEPAKAEAKSETKAESKSEPKAESKPEAKTPEATA